MQRIAIINEKGGVGKSSTAVALAGAYVKAGRKVLLIDLDPQASLTRGLIGSAETDAIPSAQTCAALFGDSFVPADRLVIPTAFAGLFLLPGSRALNPFNLPDPRESAGLFAVRDLDLDGFERVLIDAPPNLYLLSRAAMASADWVLTPTRADPYGVQAIQFVREAVANVEAAQLGYLLVAYKPRSAVHQTYAAGLRRDFPGLLLEATIPESNAFPEAAMVQTPITHYKPRGAAAKAVVAVMEEIEARIANTLKHKEAA